MCSVVDGISENKEKKLSFILKYPKYPFQLPDEFWFISTDHWVDILDRNELTLRIKKAIWGKVSSSQTGRADWELFI